MMWLLSSMGAPYQKNKENNADERYFPRWEARNRVVYQRPLHASSNEGHTKDLSCAGACIFVKEPLPLRQRLKLTIYLSPRTKLDIQGTVVWQNASSPPFQTGIAFYNTPHEAQDMILEHAFEINRRKITDYWFKGWEDE